MGRKRLFFNKNAFNFKLAGDCNFMVLLYLDLAYKAVKIKLHRISSSNII